MRMKDRETIEENFSYFATQLRDNHPNLSYLHAVEPRIAGNEDQKEGHSDTDSNDFLRKIWGNKAFISAGGYDRASGIEAAERTNELIAYGRHFIPNVCAHLFCRNLLELTIIF
jgi:NADPH2 dehydrogenase